MPTAGLAERKCKLVERLGLHLEQDKQIPPLSARILALLILHGMQGTTFETLVKELAASKSSISTNLNRMVVQGHILYFTKPGDRKRYYFSAPGYVSRMIVSLLDRWRGESELLARVLAYKDAVNAAGIEGPITTHVERDALEFFSECITFFTALAARYGEREKQYNPHA
ncbi:MAG TPA: helix-turn-helix domain-containing protein [Flavobacteriales bacterium]|nr:helix-turn-helix domain-containing protein [Flavobacteriales bacterium]HRP82266.1 helix-turn-helix domain-containing protein [Flavobacteriales bacterium]